MLVLPEEVLDEYKEKTKGEINVALPGVVVSYDSTTQKASVRPVVRYWYQSQTDEEFSAQFPVIPQVPVAFFRAGNFGLSAPLNAGDFVTLLVQDRSIDEFMKTGNADNIAFDPRRFDWTDAIAIPNPPSPEPLATLDADNLVLGSEASALKLSPAGKMALEAGGSELIDLVEQLVTICIAGVTGMGVPTFTAQQPQLAQIKAALALMKL